MSAAGRSGSKNPEGPRFAIALLAKASDYSVFSPEITMAKVNLSGMSAEALMDLRTRVDEVLLKRRADIERQLERMGSAITVVGGRDGGSTLKGKKVPPKYRGPSGETWAGRGVRPRWLVAAIKGGKKLDDFLIDKSARKGRKKRRSKR
jgi:DNA-binding protein H-NS